MDEQTEDLKNLTKAQFVHKYAKLPEKIDINKLPKIQTGKGCYFPWNSMDPMKLLEYMEKMDFKLIVEHRIPFFDGYPNRVFILGYFMYGMTIIEDNEQYTKKDINDAISILEKKEYTSLLEIGENQEIIPFSSIIATIFILATGKNEPWVIDLIRKEFNLPDPTIYMNVAGQTKIHRFSLEGTIITINDILECERRMDNLLNNSCG